MSPWDVVPCALTPVWIRDPSPCLCGPNCVHMWELSCTCLSLPKVLNYIIVLLELCVVDCKVLKFTVWVYRSVVQQESEWLPQDTPQVPVYGTCGKYPVWYQTTESASALPKSWEPSFPSLAKSWEPSVPSLAKSWDPSVSSLAESWEAKSFSFLPKFKEVASPNPCRHQEDLEIWIHMETTL